MADLIAITFDNYDQAQAARQAFGEMSREHVVELADSAIAYKDARNRVSLDQTVNLAAAGAAHGGFWGLLVGLILSIPTGGLVLPAITAGVGVGLGALGGKLSDYGIDDSMMKALASDIDAGKATLFILARKVTADRVVEHLKGFRGKVLKTSLKRELEQELQRALERGQAA